MQISCSISSVFGQTCLGVALLAALGCPTVDVPSFDGSTTDQPTTTVGVGCLPGEQSTCACPGDVEGVQVCNAEGDGVGPCQCDPIPPGNTSTPTEDSTTGDTTTGDTTTGDTTTGDSTTGDLESTGSESTGDEESVCDAYMADPGEECDVWLQDCPAGDKCMPWANGGGTWNDTTCSEIAVGPGQPGDVCTVQGSGTSGIDDCDLGSVCWGVDAETNMGTCVEQCTGCPDEPSCSDPANICTISNNDVLTLCLPGCNPLLQNCDPGDACYPIDDAFTCAPDASGDLGAYGDPCEFINVCDPGLACLGAAAVPGCLGASGCCSEFCDITDPAGDAQCMGAGQTCQAWYEAGMAPMGYEDVGACALPA